MEKNELLCSFTIFKYLTRMSLTLSESRDYSLVEIAREIDISRVSPLYQDLTSFLIQEEIFVVVRVIGRMQLVRVNIKKMDKLIGESIIYEIFAEYIRNKKLIYANI